MNITLRRGLATIATLNTRPSKIACIGRNYADHIKELGSARPRQPFFFFKPPTCVLRPGEGPVIRPRGVDLHHEVELALILGKKVKDLSPDDEQGAMDAIGGYALSIDMTARNIQNEAKRKGLPWDTAKGFDTFLPVSRAIPRARIPDPHRVELWLKVNGRTRQQDSTELLLFRIPRVLSEVSRVVTLEEGDIVITGTPKGVGPVVPGDLITAGIRVGGKELEEAAIEVAVEESKGAYVYEET